MYDFYKGLLGIPIPGALLPVVAFAFLAIYDRNLALAISLVILAIGHLGIHIVHLNEAKATCS